MTTMASPAITESATAVVPTSRRPVPTPPRARPVLTVVPSAPPAAIVQPAPVVVAASAVESAPFELPKLQSDLDVQVFARCQEIVKGWTFGDQRYFMKHLQTDETTVDGVQLVPETVQERLLELRNAPTKRGKLNSAELLDVIAFALMARNLEGFKREIRRNAMLAAAAIKAAAAQQAALDQIVVDREADRVRRAALAGSGRVNPTAPDQSAKRPLNEGDLTRAEAEALRAAFAASLIVNSEINEREALKAVLTGQYKWVRGYVFSGVKPEALPGPFTQLKLALSTAANRLQIVRGQAVSQTAKY